MVQNKALVYLQVPDGWPQLDQDIAVKDIGFDTEAAAPEGGFTVKVLYASFDPYMRPRMRDPSIKSYQPAFEVGKPLSNFAIGKVLKSNVDNFAPGDILKGFFDIAEYCAVAHPQMVKNAAKIENPLDLPLPYFIGPLGMPGLTAYTSMYEIGKPQKGQTAFISAASGAVGQIAGQIAKHEGMRVIGSVGSQSKLDFITNTLGFDGGFNYKEEKPEDALQRLAPDGVDLYFDNVGAEQLDAALAAANVRARFVMCGQISQYNNKSGEASYGLKNTINIVAKRLTLRGFIVSDPDFSGSYLVKHVQDFSKQIKDGSLKVVLDETRGIDSAGIGFLNMLKGVNFGKAFVAIADQ